MTNGLYVHIPFCGAICHYCDFVKFIYHKPWVKPYLERLSFDLGYFKVPVDLHTIYVGGGTPSSLSFKELESLLKLLHPYTEHIVEYTFEANIESLTLPKLLLLQKYGVNRLSIGVQSTNDERLHELNRQHSYADIKRKIGLVKKAGFTNFSVDLIYGLPNQSLEELNNDVANILKINPPHIATYALSIEPNTVAFIRKWPLVSDGESRQMYDQILATLRQNGYERYEVSNFAKPGYDSIHNQRYWQNLSYYGIGLGAAGYIGNKRYKIAGGLSSYLKGNSRIEEELITPAMYIEEYLMLHLRLKKGFSLADFKLRTGHDFLIEYHDKIDNLVNRGLLEVTQNDVFCTDEGIMLLDTVILKLIS